MNKGTELLEGLNAFTEHTNDFTNILIIIACAFGLMIAIGLIQVLFKSSPNSLNEENSEKNE